MENVVRIASRAVGVAALLYTIYLTWTSLLLLSSTFVVVLLSWRYLDQRLQTLLSPEGRVVLITGCDTGFGYDTALAASERGLTVVATCLDVQSPGAQQLAKTKRVHVLQLDVAKDDSVEAALPQVAKICSGKGLWAVVNNAGFNRMSPVELTSMKTFHHVAEVMLFGTIRVTKAFLPLVRQAKGRMVNLSSERGMRSPIYSAAYCIAKHAVETFSDVLRKEVKPFGVSVSIVQPGHFGGATAILNQQGIDAMRASMELDLKACPEEVQEAYCGQNVVQKIIDACVACRETSKMDTSPVVQAILLAILANQPASRYPVHGTNDFIDWSIVLGQFKPLMSWTVLTWLESALIKR